MNDELCKEERERLSEADRKLTGITSTKPRMRPGGTKIHKPDSKINIQKPDFVEPSEKWKIEFEKAQQKRDKALKEYDECRKRHRIKT